MPGCCAGFNILVRTRRQDQNVLNTPLKSTESGIVDQVLIITNLKTNKACSNNTSKHVYEIESSTHTGLPEYRHTGLPEYRHTGLSEYRHTGLSEYRHTGQYRHIGLSEYRHTGLSVYRHTCLLTGVPANYVLGIMYEYYDLSGVHTVHCIIQNLSFEYSKFGVKECIF
jgi:hypothetical protein